MLCADVAVWGQSDEGRTLGESDDDTDVDKMTLTETTTTEFAHESGDERLVFWASSEIP